MKKRKFVLLSGAVFFSLTFLLYAGGGGTAASVPKLVISPYFLKPQPLRTRINEPADLLDLIPVVKEINQMIPRQFSLVNHEFSLATNQVVIQHHFYTERTKKSAKNSIISLSYYGDLGRQFETRVDVPLFYSPMVGVEDWNRYPMGNYTMTITQNRFLDERFYIKAQARF